MIRLCDAWSSTLVHSLPDSSHSQAKGNEIARTVMVNIEAACQRGALDLYPKNRDATIATTAGHHIRPSTSSQL